MIIILLILVLCADIYTTWLLLTKYRDKVREGGVIGSALTEAGYNGQMIWVAARLLVLFAVIQSQMWQVWAAWGLVTLYAVINNMLVWRKLHGR
jgi:hypothetical protein